MISRKQSDSKQLLCEDNNNKKEKTRQNDTIIYRKEKGKASEMKKKRSIKSIKSNKSKNKGEKLNSLAPPTQPKEGKKVLKEELKKINDFRKILTKNSKIYARKYGEEILRNILTLNSNNHKINKEFIYNNKNKIKLLGRKFFSNKNNIITNKAFNTLMNCSDKNINVNIINSFKIINEAIKRNNSYEKEDLNNYLKKYEFLQNNTPTNKKTTIDKSEDVSIIRFYSFNKKRKSPRKKKNKPKFKLDKSFSKKSYRFDSIKLHHNISFHFKPQQLTKISNKKEDTNKIVFYSILLHNLYNKYISQNRLYVKTKEEKEEEKKRFLYQLYYCLGLTKIYILNFKENKLFSEGILALKNKNKDNKKKLSNFSDNSCIRFKTFYETFSNYSQIKISTVEKFESYPNIEQVNQYFIFKDKQLGKGGSSIVYLGEDEEKQKKYAIKVTDKNLKANPFKHIYDYVKEEVSILKRIHSKYIVTTYEVIESKSRIYIIMEYMSLGSVFNLIDTLKEDQIKQYTRNLICAVEHCHKIANIIHKDINVNNLLINKDGIAKLCDFGISEVFEDDNDLLPSKGPSTYTPPEKKYNAQYRGKPADIYLIGLTLYHMVYKRPLFSDFGNLTKNDYININIPKTDDKNNEININLYNLIKSLLNFNPDKRPTINELKRNPWLTDDMKNPFPDVIKEALFYSLELTRKQIKSMKNDNDNSNTNMNDITKDNKVEEEESEETEEEDEEEESLENNEEM